MSIIFSPTWLHAYPRYAERVNPHPSYIESSKSGLRACHRQYGMCGPRLVASEKMRIALRSTQMYPVLVESWTPDKQETWSRRIHRTGTQHNKAAVECQS